MRASPRCTRCCVAFRAAPARTACTEPAVGGEIAGDQVEQRGLAGAVRSDDQPALARHHRERDVPGRRQPAEALVEMRDFERRRGHARRLRRGAAFAARPLRRFAQPLPQLPCSPAPGRRHEHDHDHEDHAEQRVPALDVGRDHVLDQRDDGGADDRAGERARAAEDRHQQDFGGLLQRDRVRAEEQIVVDVEHARRPSPRSRPSRR